MGKVKKPHQPEELPIPFKEPGTLPNTLPELHPGTDPSIPKNPTEVPPGYPDEPTGPQTPPELGRGMAGRIWIPFIRSVLSAPE